MGLIIPVLLLALAIPLVVALLRANELFLLRCRRGRLRLVRGRIPPRLLADIDEVLSRAEIGDIELRGVSEDGRARLYAQGLRLPRPVRQQLRNTVAPWPVATIRAANRRASRQAP